MAENLQGRRRCRCKKHDEWSLFPSNVSNIVNDKGKVLPISIEKKLKSENMLEGNFVCVNCAEYAKVKFNFKGKRQRLDSSRVANEDTSMDEDNSPIPDYAETIAQIQFAIRSISKKIESLPEHVKREIDVSPLVNCIPSNLMSSLASHIARTQNCDTLSLLHLAEALGKSVSIDVHRDAGSLQLKYKRSETLSSMNIAAYISERNQVIVKFITGVSGIDPTSGMQSKQLFRFGVLMEAIYRLCHGNVVLPLSFAANLVQFVTSGFKTVPVVNAKIGAGGSYPMIHDWMEEVGAPLTAPHGDTEVYFDNIGRYVLKSYRVSASGYKKGRVFTTGIYITLSDDMELQKRLDLLPANWTFENVNLLSLMFSKISDAKRQFAYFRACFIEKMLKIVSMEEKDEVDKVCVRANDFSLKIDSLNFFAEKKMLFCSRQLCRKSDSFDLFA